MRSLHYQHFYKFLKLTWQGSFLFLFVGSGLQNEKKKEWEKWTTVCENKIKNVLAGGRHIKMTRGLLKTFCFVPILELKQKQRMPFLCFTLKINPAQSMFILNIYLFAYSKQ